MRFTLPSIISRTSEEISAIFRRAQKATFLSCDWRILIHFVCFCFWMSVTIIIDGSIKHNRNFAFELQSLHAIEKSYNMN